MAMASAAAAWCVHIHRRAVSKRSLARPTLGSGLHSRGLGGQTGLTSKTDHLCTVPTPTAIPRVPTNPEKRHNGNRCCHCHHGTKNSCPLPLLQQRQSDYPAAAVCMARAGTSRLDSPIARRSRCKMRVKEEEGKFKNAGEEATRIHLTIVKV